MNLKKLVVSLATIPFLSGCVGFMIKGSDFKKEKPLPQSIKDYYSYEKKPINYTITNREKHANYVIKTIEFPSAVYTTEGNKTVKISYYDLNGEEKTPLIIISPILGGNNVVSKIFANYFANHNFATAIIHRPEDQKITGPNYAVSIEELLKQPLIDMRRAIDLFETFKDIDNERIGSFGVSMGGIRNATLAGIDQRLKVNVFVMAGADIPYILKHSKDTSIRREVEKAQESTEGDLFELLSKEIKSDPKYLSQYIDDDNTLMFITLFDEVVPLKSQKYLRELIGNPSVAYLLAGHYTAALYLLPPFYYVQNTSLIFFKEKFDKIKLSNCTTNCD